MTKMCSDGGATNINNWLATSPAKFVTLNFGTNDANNTVSATVFYNNMKTMIDAVIAAGRIPVIPTIPWGRTTNLQNNVPPMNAKIAQLYMEYPQIIHGPDLYSYFNANQTLISGDNIHPTDPAGYTAYRTQWVEAMKTAVYTVPTLSAAPTAGSFNDAQSVTLTASKTGTVYYTTNGTTPTTSSTVYSSAIAISSTTTLKALAVDQAGNQSDVLTQVYTINTPSPSPSPSPTPEPSSAPAANSTRHISVTVLTVPDDTASDELTAVAPSAPVSEPTSTISTLKNITVIVKDAAGQPLSNVTVTLHSTPQTAVTDSNGKATFTGVEPGEHTLTVEGPDYQGSQSIAVAADPATTTYTFALTVQPKAGFPWWLVGGGVALLLVLVALVLFMLRRRRVIVGTLG